MPEFLVLEFSLFFFSPLFSVVVALTHNLSCSHQLHSHDLWYLYSRFLAKGFQSGHA